MSTVQLKLVASSAASAQQQQQSQNNNKDKYVKVTVPVHWTVGQLRQLAALATGVCADLAEKLKLELQASSGDIGSKKKSSARKAKHAATLTTGTSVPLNEMAAQLHRFDLEAENLTVVITNWNKIGSMKKFEIVAMMHCIRSCNVGTDQQNMNAINAALVSAQDDTNFLASVVQVGQVNGSSALLKKLLKLVGFNVSDSGEVTIEAKQMTRNRRLQLFQEVVKSDTITNHADYSDCFKFPKPSLMRTFPNSADDAEEEEQKDYPPVGHLSAPTSPVVLRTEQRLFHARQHSLDEEGEDYQSDLLDDFVLSPTSRTGGNSRSRDRRRRRRERARVLLSQYQDLDYNDEADIAYASEQIRREGVPTGLDVSILRRLPVQTLTEKDMEIMMKKRECHDTHGDNFCAICLVEYHIDDAVMRLPCMHVYHRSCITKWLSANNKCPQDMIAISI